MTKLSIIVPVHNTATYLPKCVASLAEQSVDDMEIILVENCSTDNSLEVCHALAEADTRVKVISIAEGHPSAARNAGIKIAQGDYLGFVDRDDFVDKEMYGDMYSLAVEHNLGVVACSFRMEYDDGTTKCAMPNDGSIQLLSGKEITLLNLHDKISRVIPTMLIKRELLAEFEFPSGVYFEDRATTHMLMSRAERGGVINRAYYGYFSRKGSRMHNGDNFKRMRDFVWANSCRLEFVRTSPLFTDSERAYAAERCAEQYLRKLRHLLRLASTAEEREEALLWCRKIELISKAVRLPLKARAIRWYIRMFVI